MDMVQQGVATQRRKGVKKITGWQLKAKPVIFSFFVRLACPLLLHYAWGFLFKKESRAFEKKRFDFVQFRGIKREHIYTR